MPYQNQSFVEPLICFYFQKENILMSPDSDEVYSYKRETEQRGKHIVLEKKQKLNRTHMKEDKSFNQTFLQRQFPKRPWSRDGEITTQKDKKAKSPRQACFRVHVVKNSH